MICVAQQIGNAMTFRDPLVITGLIFGIAGLVCAILGFLNATAEDNGRPFLTIAISLNLVALICLLVKITRNQKGRPVQ